MHVNLKTMLNKCKLKFMQFSSITVFKIFDLSRNYTVAQVMHLYASFLIIGQYASLSAR